MSYVYLGTLKGHENYHYEFTCPECGENIILATGMGRYGNLGGFSCPKCNKKYYATIDDHQKPKLYVNYKGEQPNSYLDGNKNSLFILKERDNLD